MERELMVANDRVTELLDDKLLEIVRSKNIVNVQARLAERILITL